MYSAQGEQFDAVVVDLAKPPRTNSREFWLACYVMLSRATSLDGLLISRLCNKKDLEQGPPQFLIDEVDRLGALETHSQDALQAYLSRAISPLPAEITHCLTEKI